MKYRSTVGTLKNLTFREALFSTGFLNDGGLLLPETIPLVDSPTMERWSRLTYPDLVFEIAELYVDDEEVPRNDLQRLIKEALSSFTAEEVLPVRILPNGIRVLEMFHGKTWAFKDLALSCVGKFIDYFMRKERQRVIILVGTSGDTGSAVLEAVRVLESVDCIVILPRDRCSEVQERQMTTIIGKNVHVFRADGSSDDLDEPIKNCFTDEEFAEKHHLISLNSINWSRIMIQIAHHFYAYFKACSKIGDAVEIVVPTGAMGNVTSGIMAYKMGLPVRYVTAVTCNDVVDRMIKTGDVIIRDDVIASLATAMNIANPYNMQRLVRLFSNDDCTRQFIAELDQNKMATVPIEVLEKIRHVVSSYHGTDDVIKQTIRRCYNDNQYIVCPHTALAVAYCYQQLHHQGNDGIQRICLATASPYKFSDSVTSSGVTLPPNNDVTRLMEKSVKFTDMEKHENWTKILREKIEQISLQYAKTVDEI